MSKYNIIEIVESSAITNNEVFAKNTILTFYNDPSKIKIADGKTRFNSLPAIGGSSGTIPPAVQTALDAKVDKTITVAGKPLSANVTLTGTDVGLGAVNNTSDTAKPISTATQTALNAKLTATKAAAPTTAVATDPTDLPTALTSIIELKGVINGLIAKLQAANISA